MYGDILPDFTFSTAKEELDKDLFMIAQLHSFYKGYIIITKQR